MVYRELSAVWSKNNTNHWSKICGKNLDLGMWKPWKLGLELARSFTLLISRCRCAGPGYGRKAVTLFAVKVLTTQRHAFTPSGSHSSEHHAPLNVVFQQYRRPCALLQDAERGCSPFDISSRAQLDVGGSATVTVGVAVEVVVMSTATGLVELHVMHRMATGPRHSLPIVGLGPLTSRNKLQ
jgi:hypothetical protein